MADTACFSCENSELKRKSKSIDKIKEKARTWAKANNYIGALVIVEENGRYGFRKPDCPCFNEPNPPTQLETIYVD